jgi:phenylpropionate dioxygenase-like ring-hydroxylating dioxygenase large terminal subunit
MDLHNVFREGRAHRSIYTDQAIFERELERVFGGTWVYMAHDSEFPQANDFVSRRLGKRPLIMTRDATGDVHALFNRCTHRAATICQEQAGNRKRFTCAYHGWTFANDGSCVGVPYPAAYGPEHDKSRHDLAQVARLASYRGFWFVTLNPDTPSLEEFLGPAAYWIDLFVDRAPSGTISLHRPYRMTYRGNWKLIWDNGSDGYHPAFSHRSILKMTQERYGQGRSLDNFGAQDPDDGPMYNQALGHGHTMLDQRPGMGDSLWQRVRPMPSKEPMYASLVERYGREEADRVVEMAPGPGLNLTVFPSFHLIGNQVVTVEPLEVGLTAVNWYPTTLDGAPDEVNELRMRIAEDFPNFGEVDDFENFERQQIGLTIPEVEWIDMSRGLTIDRSWQDERGVTTTPVTDDGPLRSYHQEWRRLMTCDMTLVAR